MNKKGFTLIELLVVIAIIGILSSVVLASLNSARGKGSNAAIKSNMANLRAGAELTYDNDGGTYVNVCDSAQFLAASTSINSGFRCTDDANGWSAFAALKVAEGSNSAYCVGSSGAAMATTSIPTTIVTSTCR